MKALAVRPGVPNSARLIEVPEPEPSQNELLVEMMCVGVCGTDIEIIRGDYGQAPPGSEYLILGHESLGRVLKAPPNSGFSEGDLVVGVVRRPDPEPCPNCAVGEWDMCRNGRYTERGIKGLHGYCSERYTLETDFAVKVAPELGELGVLLEPASVLAKAWEHIERIGSRARFTPRRVVVTGAGPVGLMAALMARQRDYQVFVLNRSHEGPKPELVRRLGAQYLTDHRELESLCQTVDIGLECSGAAELVLDIIRCGGPDSIICLTGVSSKGRMFEIDTGMLGRRLVLENEVVFGSVNANLRHYRKAAEALAMADRDWLAGMITRRVPLDRALEALVRGHSDIKAIITGPAWRPAGFLHPH